LLTGRSPPVCCGCIYACMNGDGGLYVQCNHLPYSVHSAAACARQQQHLTARDWQEHKIGMWTSSAASD
jgi:hypothetical protein